MFYFLLNSQAVNKHTYGNLLGCGRMDTLAPCLQGRGEASGRYPDRCNSLQPQHTSGRTFRRAERWADEWYTQQCGPVGPTASVATHIESTRNCPTHCNLINQHSIHHQRP